jgi:pimeloyl-ACP methyl ester carboxylesterase
LFLPNSSHASPTLLLLHGTSIYGRKLPLIQILAKEFQSLGYVVLAIDFRGYGESDDPDSLTCPDDFNFAQDICSAIDYLLENVPVDPSQIYILGHSFGAGSALSAQENDTRIRKLILFGPPRRLSERFLDADAKDRNFILLRMKRDMQLSYDLDFDIWRKVVQKRNIENYIENFSQADHIPLFLIDSEDEDPRDLEFLERIYQKLSPPVNYWTVPKTNHYLNTGRLLGKYIYGKEIIDNFVCNIDFWLKG